MMRMWDPVQKKVIFVTEPPSTGDWLTLTVRLHDPKERQHAHLSSAWHVVKVPRTDLKLSAEEFGAKYLMPALETLAGMRNR